MDERYLPAFKKIIHRNPIRHPQILFVRSAMGTGKTSRFMDYISIKKKTSALIISSRITYTQAFCSRKRFGFLNYQNIRTNIDYINHPRVVIQYQSLHRIRLLKETENFEKWDVLFLDEIDSLLKECLSQTMTKTKRLANIKCFQKLISSIPTVIVCDANLAEWHCDIILNHLMLISNTKKRSLLLNSNKGMLRNDMLVRVYTNFSLCPNQAKVFSNAVCDVSYDTEEDENKYALLNKRSEHKLLNRFMIIDRELSWRKTRKSVGFMDHTYMTILSNWYSKYSSSNPYLQAFIRGDASRAMFDDVMQKKQSVVAICNTKALAYYIYCFYTSYCNLKPDIEVVLLTGDCSVDEKHKITSTETMKKSLENCRVFIYTSCIKVGVDVSTKEFDKVYLFLNKIKKSSPLNLSDFYQMVGRIRYFRSLCIAINDLPFNKKYKKGFDCVGDLLALLSGKSHHYQQHPNNDPINDKKDILLRLTEKVSVESKLKKHPILFFKCLLKMFISSTPSRSHGAFFFDKSYSNVCELFRSLCNYKVSLSHIYTCIITTYLKYKQHLEHFKDQLINNITKKVFTSTQLYSLDMFKEFVKKSGDQRKTVEEICFMITALTSLKGILAICAEVEKSYIEKYFKERFDNQSAVITTRDVDADKIYDDLMTSNDDSDVQFNFHFFF